MVVNNVRIPFICYALFYVELYWIYKSPLISNLMNILFIKIIVKNSSFEFYIWNWIKMKFKCK